CLSFAFDHGGAWLLLAVQHGMLYAVRTDGSPAEVLPRGMNGGHPVRDVGAVLGVAGGFVLTTTSPGPAAVHHAFRGRPCRVCPFRARPEGGSGAFGAGLTWAYLRAAHTLFFWQGPGATLQSVNLSTGSREPDRAAQTDMSEATRSYHSVVQDV